MSAAIPFISVVIPHLNQPEGLARCLASLQAQSYPAEAFEVIVVDNGSSQPPEAVVARFPGVRMLSEPTPGPGPARNKGVAAAKGKILAFIDADCIADANWLQVIAKAMAKAATNPCAKGPVLGGKVSIALKAPPHPIGIEAYEMVFAYRQKLYIEKKGFSGTGNLAVRAADFTAIGPFGGIEIAEDSDWGRRAGAMGFEIRYLPEMIVKHPARTTSAELRAKWARQISHDYAMHRASGKSRASWCLRALAVGLSPLADGLRLLAAAPAAVGLVARLQATAILVSLRLWRMARMLRLAVSTQPNDQTLRWNTCSRS